MPEASNTATRLYVARQPILDLKGRVFGYELLYREDPRDRACFADGDTASASVLTGALLDLGLDSLTGGRQAFFNLTRSLLDQIGSLIRPQDAVIEVLETIAIDDDVVEACRTLHGKGYRLALDDFVPGSDAEALLPYVSFVKVDVLATEDGLARELPKRLTPLGIGMLAEKVERREVHQCMRDAGYSLFQGFHFCRPMLQEGTTLPAQQIVYLRLLAAISQPDLSTLQIEQLVKQDVSLTLRVLRSVNSAAYPIRTEIRSIGQALFLLGIDPVRRWVSVWCLAGLSANATSELATLALLRGRTCELLGEHVHDIESSELFLVGLFSLLDAMLTVPMASALEHLPLSEHAVAALLGHPNTLRAVLDAVIPYERGDWDEAMTLSAHAGLPPSALANAHTKALRWVQDVTRAA